MCLCSCSSDGNAVLYALGELDVQEIKVNLNQPLQCICVDKISLSKKDRSFIVGTYLLVLFVSCCAAIGESVL